jgi:hypothetical protein
MWDEKVSLKAIAPSAQAFDLPLKTQPGRGWSPTRFFEGFTEDLRKLSGHASTLLPGHCPHPPHGHFEEEVLVVLRGRGELATKVLIFAHGRVGSTALQSCFPPAEVAYMNEPLRHHWKPWSVDWLPDNAADYLEKLALSTSSKPAVIAHVKPEHVGENRHLVVPFLQGLASRGWRILHLERLDSWAQGQSFVRSRLLQRYNTEDVAEGAALAATVVSADPVTIRAAIMRNEVLNRDFLSSAGVPHVHVTYEDLFAAPDGGAAAREVLETALGQPFALRAPATRKVSPAEPTTPEWAEARRWYDSHIKA